jgi:hypothetical protein
MPFLERYAVTGQDGVGITARNADEQWNIDALRELLW